MSSGESDIAMLARDRLARTGSLDAYTRCTALGCEFMVHLSGGDARCHAHGGRDGVPEYLTDSDSGAFIAVRHMTTAFGTECE